MGVSGARGAVAAALSVSGPGEGQVLLWQEQIGERANQLRLGQQTVQKAVITR